MGKCTNCNSPNTNKSSCPLVLKNPKKEHWDKHFLANYAMKPKEKHVMNPKHINSYYLIYLTIKKTIDIIKNKIVQSKNKRIIIFGIELKRLRIYVKDPKSLKVEIILSNQFITKFNNYMDLLIDIYKTLGGLKCDRIDFFVNPDTRVANLFDIINETSREIIKSLINNRYYRGGNCNCVPQGQSIEDMIDISECDYIESKFSMLPSVPKTIPMSISQKSKQKIGINF